ncbi:hypothetical protein L541_3170 [Bordetella hinzii CA90 BAL1384]|uniref:hypothetical protein n=1 Tax=Bordetella hinzii TaxID=103855 RepID=UPI00045A5E1F|nr:hypothetical protein [Bordetella hinzii]KCB31569.1 hypothetical protein L541_3170 [Bordetella hinzii CA90 BAL1384]
MNDVLNDALSNLEHDNYERSHKGYENRQADVAMIRAALAAQPAASAEPSDEEIDAIAASMPGGAGGMLKQWGYRQFARALLSRYGRPAGDAEYPLAAKVCAELYQVIGSLASDLGVFDHPKVVKALDNAADHALVHDDVLPFPSFEHKTAGDAQPAVWVAADTLNSPHPTCVSSLAYMSQLDRDRGREYVPLYAAPVAAQAPAAAMPDEIEGLRAHVALLKSALAQSERENDELRALAAAGDAQPAVWVAADTLNSPHPTCVSSLAYMSQLDRDRGREYVPLYAAPVAAQAPRPCTCHPDDRPDGPCREKYAASECQAPADAGDALGAFRRWWLSLPDDLKNGYADNGVHAAEVAFCAAIAQQGKGSAAPQASEAVRDAALKRACSLREVTCKKCGLQVISSCRGDGCPVKDRYADLRALSAQPGARK